jgi:hypothetical protein
VHGSLANRADHAALANHGQALIKLGLGNGLVADIAEVDFHEVETEQKD